MLPVSLPHGVRAVVLAVVVSFLIACDGRGSRLRASWDGPKAGKLRAPATASWCPRAGRLEIQSVQDDAGIALVIYPAESLRAARYEAFDPGLYSMQRPGSAAAARWFTEQEVRGYQSDSGWADLTRDGENYVVRFGYRMIAANRVDTLRLSGQVSAFLPGACPLDRAPDSTASE